MNENSKIEELDKEEAQVNYDIESSIIKQVEIIDNEANDSRNKLPNLSN